jgi:hypothetical protein
VAEGNTGLSDDNILANDSEKLKLVRAPAARALLLTFAAPILASAQTPQAPPPTVFTFAQAVRYALDRYPTVRAALEQINAATAGVTVAHRHTCRGLDSLWQSNRGTANNILGQILPRSVIPAMSGPVLPAASSAPAI